MKSKPLPKSNEKVCGVLKTAGFDAIKKVYRENILKHHPGNECLFYKIVEFIF